MSGRTAPAACARASRAAISSRSTAAVAVTAARTSIPAPTRASTRSCLGAASRTRWPRKSASAPPGSPPRPELPGAVDEPVQPVVDDRLEQRLLRGEVPVERAGADARAPGDLVERHGDALLGERLLGDLEQPVPVALRVGAQRPSLGHVRPPPARLPRCPAVSGAHSPVRWNRGALFRFIADSTGAPEGLRHARVRLPRPPHPRPRPAPRGRPSTACWPPRPAPTRAHWPTSTRRTSSSRCRSPRPGSIRPAPRPPARSCGPASGRAPRCAATRASTRCACTRPPTPRWSSPSTGSPAGCSRPARGSPSRSRWSSPCATATSSTPATTPTRWRAPRRSAGSRPSSTHWPGAARSPRTPRRTQRRPPRRTPNRPPGRQQPRRPRSPRTTAPRSPN